MQNSSEFQYIAIDTIHESATNPRRTFNEAKLYERVKTGWNVSLKMTTSPAILALPSASYIRRTMTKARDWAER